MRQASLYQKNKLISNREMKGVVYAEFHIETADESNGSVSKEKGN